MFNLLTSLLPKLDLLGRWNYWIVLVVATLESTAFIGLLVPGTTIIILIGFLASQKIFDVGDAMWFVAIGGIIGDTISYFLGKKGINLFKPESRIFKPKFLTKGKSFFDRHGKKSIILARFIGPIRPIVPFVAPHPHAPPRFFYSQRHRRRCRGRHIRSYWLLLRRPLATVSPRHPAF